MSVLSIGAAGLPPGVDGSGVGKLCVPSKVCFAGVGGCGAVVDTILFSFLHIDFERRRAANGMVAGA